MTCIATSPVDRVVRPTVHVFLAGKHCAAKFGCRVGRDAPWLASQKWSRFARSSSPVHLPSPLTVALVWTVLGLQRTQGMKTTTSTLAVLAGAAVAVHACGTEREFAVVRRDAIQRRQQAAAGARPTDEAGMAQVTDPAQECAYYNYPPVAALVRRVSSDRTVFTRSRGSTPSTASFKEGELTADHACLHAQTARAKGVPAHLADRQPFVRPSCVFFSSPPSAPTSVPLSLPNSFALRVPRSHAVSFLHLR